LTIASSNISNLQKSIAKYSIAPFNKRDDYENLPIHTAAAFGKPENIEFLVKNNINSIESVNNQQHTPLISAILTGNRATLKKLIDLGANINHLLPNTFFPLLFALHIGDL
jgi:ankyrin repeat protein